MSQTTCAGRLLRERCPFATLWLLTLGLAAPATAQPLGTFTWRLQPFCNRVTATDTPVWPGRAGAGPYLPLEPQRDLERQRGQRRPFAFGAKATGSPRPGPAAPESGRAWPARVRLARRCVRLARERVGGVRERGGWRRRHHDRTSTNTSVGAGAPAALTAGAGNTAAGSSALTTVKRDWTCAKASLLDRRR